MTGRNAFGCSCSSRFCNGAEFHTKQARARGTASACRELWRQYRAMSDVKLRSEHDRYVFLLTYGPAKSVRPENIQKVDLWYLRLIRREMVRRGMGWIEPAGHVLTCLSGA